MRSACAPYKSSALATSSAFVVNSLASPKSCRTLYAQRRTDRILHFLFTVNVKDVPTHIRASRMCDRAFSDVHELQRVAVVFDFRRSSPNGI